MTFSSYEDEGQDEILISTMRSLDLAQKSDSPNSLLGPPLPADTFRSRRGQPLLLEQEQQPLDLPTCHSDTLSPTTTVFSTSESLYLYQQQQQQQQPTANAANVLKENFALVQKNVLALQEVASVRNDQVRLENQVYQLDQNLAESRKENQRLLRSKRDFDRQLQQSNAAFERERSLWSDREAELVRSLKFATRPLIVQPPAKDQYDTDKVPVDALPPQIQQQIAEKNAAQARALRAREKLVSELRQQVLDINQDIIERQRNNNLRESELQAEIAQARELNKSLMEENESFQMLLHEKSMNGEFMQTSIMKNTGYDDDLSGTSLGAQSSGSINLADELGKAFERSPLPTADRTVDSLMEEVKTLKESNTALGLYISKILSRIMENPHLQAILAADYTPQRTALPESPAAIPQANKPNNGSNNASDTDSKKDSMTRKKPEVGRARSRSLFLGFSRPKPASNRSSSEDDGTSGTSTGPISFQDGHLIEEDSPRTSYSSSEYAFVNNDHTRPMEYELLTTFDQPFTRKQLQRHASMSSTAGYERNRRRQTISSPASHHTAASGHGRYGSEPSAIQPSQIKRSTMFKTKNNVNVLAPMPETQPSDAFEVPSIPEGESESMESVRSPTLSIATSVSSSSSNNSSWNRQGR
ncbi:hypothetical protein BG011_004013 [Mortierella polycephala]|uniref:Uncharacterized protein n=1 Tax=Mortierella polycephala TaxID=41804 RepID=A0A9P6U2X9_9FUNG|nr:hypothetical protein BG011_004013 [Mortierella polycephala]